MSDRSPDRLSDPSRPTRFRKFGLTRSGAVTLVVGSATIAVGIVLGLAEITGLGVAVVAVTLLAAFSVAYSRPALTCDRELGVARVMVEQEVGGEIVVVNAGRRRSTAAGLHERIDGPGHASSTVTWTIRSLGPGERIHAALPLCFAHRGVTTIGPEKIITTDPFGLARRVVPGPAPTRITVLPKIDSLIASTLEIDADTRASVPTPAISGSEFASLREYVDGDDLRKVHWRATSRREELIVRRDERPRRSGCTVVLDTRATVQDPVTFERSVSAAAGILTAAIEAGQSARLCSTTGFDSGEGSGSRHLDAMLGVLAMIDTDRGAAFAPVRAHEPSILVTTAAGAGSPRGESSIGVVAPFIVAFDPLEPEPARPTGAGRGPVPVLHIGAVDDFATVWNSEIGRRRTTTTRRHAGVR